MFKRTLVSILGLVGLLTAPAAFAQSSTHTPFTQSEYYAIDYGQWGIKSQSQNVFLFSPNGLCAATASGQQFFPFATNAPVLIADGTPSLSEVVTPSSVTNASSQCGFAAAPTNTHVSFQVSSGTAGLQEALNVLAVNSKTTAYPAKIDLDRNWWSVANSIVGTSGTAILAAAKGNAHAILLDVTTAGTSSYVWNGTAFVTGTWVNTKPTVAAGAAAGTAPTISSAGTALTPTVALTEGSAPTTGTLFTLTYATSAQFLYAPTCTVASSGATSLGGLSVTSAYAASAATLTIATSATPVAAASYKFIVNCY